MVGDGAVPDPLVEEADVVGDGDVVVDQPEQGHVIGRVPVAACVAGEVLASPEGLRVEVEHGAPVGVDPEEQSQLLAHGPGLQEREQTGEHRRVPEEDVATVSLTAGDEHPVAQFQVGPVQDEEGQQRGVVEPGHRGVARLEDGGVAREVIVPGREHLPPTHPPAVCGVPPHRGEAGRPPSRPLVDLLRVGTFGLHQVDHDLATGLDHRPPAQRDDLSSLLDHVGWCGGRGHEDVLDRVVEHHGGFGLPGADAPGACTTRSSLRRVPASFRTRIS